MTNDVVLSAALRNNLLSLQNTQRNIDTTQNRLATGKKVNSALDNPQAFFAAQALSNRASDLTNLLDSIGQSIQVIKAADNGVTALTSLVNQAQAIAQSAQSAVTSASNQASATGSVALSGSTLLSNLTGFTAAGGDKISISITNPDTGALVVDGTIALGTAKGGLITTAANQTVQDLIDQINDINSRAGTGGNAPLDTPAVTAELDSSGHLKLTAVNGGTLHVQIQNATVNAQNAANSLTMATSLGYGSIVKINQLGATAGQTDTVDFTARSSAAISSNALYSSTGTLASADTLLSGLKDSGGTALTTLLAADTLKLKIGGKLSGDLLHYAPAGGTAFTGATITVGGLVDAINHDSTIKALVHADFDETTGQISLTATDPSATDVQFQFGGASGESFSKLTAAYPTGLGFGIEALTTNTQTLAQETVRFGAAAGQLSSLQTQYDTIRSQIDALTSNGDTGYGGTNLLNGDNLVTTFNESRTSTLTTNGATFTSSSLGIDAANFGNAANVQNSIDQINGALSTIRNFGSSLATDLSVIQSRQDFTNNLINTLQSGSDSLTIADQNAEGAKLLALQTRQSLGVTSLSLASQSQQAILRLF